MKSTSHFAMAHLLFAALQKQELILNRTAFVYGNIAPDYIPSMIINPHFGKVCSRRVEELSKELSAVSLEDSRSVGPEYSKTLGIICHYICDYFCFAHNRDFLGGVRQHMDFENALDSYLRRNWESLLELDGFQSMSHCLTYPQLLARLEEEKLNYISNGYSFEGDLSSAFMACLGAIKAIVAMSKRIPAANNACMEDFSLSLKGFATGNCYVFRMFFYKNRNNDIFFMPEHMQPMLS